VSPAWLHSLVDLYRTTGRYADAEILLKEALAIAESSVPSTIPIVVCTLADLYREVGRHADAVTLCNRYGLPPPTGGSQGSRMSLVCDDPEHVAVVPGGFFAPAA
jgi:hypothetical protein